MTELTELYRKHRPTKFEEVVGQEAAVTLLRNKIKSKTLNHVILFEGPSGVGKNTLAYIVANELGIENTANLIEINAADARDIDTVRQISKDMNLAAWGGGKRAWIIDEVVQLPKTTQQAFLKTLEDPSPHVWFLLCTSDTSGLLPTFLSRCLCVKLEPLSRLDLRKVLNAVLAKEGQPTCGGIVLEAILHKAQSNARKALQLLEAALAFTEEDEQLAALGKAEDDQKVEFLARALMKRARWEEISLILEKTKDAESLRRQVVTYCSKVMIGKSSLESKKLAAVVLENLLDNFYGCPEAGLALACWKCCQRKE